MGYGATTNLPVVFHIVRQNSGSGGASYSGIQCQLANTNVQYASANLSFTEYTTVDYINDDNLYNFQQLSDESSLLSHNVTNVVNVYYVNTVVTNAGNNVGGYAFFPWMSNPSIHYIIIPLGNSVDNSTLSHEMGHFFGLLHTHETANGTEFVNGSNCSTTGDLLCDTPADPGLQSCTNSSCQYTCTSSTDPNGQHYSPLVNNLMSYARSSCRQLFTNKQNSRINFYYVNLRSYLNCGPTPSSNDNCPGTSLTSSTTCNYLSNQTVNNATASGKPKGSCDGYTGTAALADVWYNFQAVGTSSTITVDPNGSALDAVIIAYNSCTNNTEIGCSDVTGGAGALSTLTIPTTAGNTYYVRFYDYGLQTTNGDFRICVTGGSSCIVPNSPLNNAPTNITATSFQANWSTVTGATAYYVDVATDVGFSNMVYNKIAGNDGFLSINALSCNMTYYYRIRASNSCGPSGNSSTNSVPTSACCTTPLSPSNNAPTNITASSFQANWSTVTGATAYYVDVATDVGFSNMVYNNVIGNNGFLNINSLSCNTTYFYRIRASNSCGPSGNSSTNSVPTSACCTTPSSPSNNAPSNITATSFKANWSTVAGATSYYVDVATDAAFSNMIYN